MFLEDFDGQLTTLEGCLRIWLDLSIRGKVLLAFSSVLFLTVLLGLFGLHESGRINDTTGEVRPSRVRQRRKLPATFNRPRMRGAVSPLTSAASANPRTRQVPRPLSCLGRPAGCPNSPNA
jgi:hypothetical protein